MQAYGRRSGWASAWGGWRGVHARLALGAWLLVWASGWAGVAVAQDTPEPAPLNNGDYAVGNDAWNGLSSLMAISERLGHPIEPVTRQDIGALGPDDRLIIIYPTEQLPVDELAGFVIDGGKVLLGDDFGGSGPFLGRLGIKQVPTEEIRHASYYLGRPGLPVFEPGGRHPLLEGVEQVVANHPAGLITRGGAILPYNDARFGLVYDMRLARGKVIVVGDSSIFINHMLKVRDNGVFVANALEYLCRDADPCSPKLLVGDFELTGEYAPQNTPDDDVFDQIGESLDQINEALEKLDDYVPPYNAVYYASLLLMGGVVVFLITIFPARRAPQVEPESGPPEGVQPLSEFEWNLKRYDRPGFQGNYVLPVAILKTEFERLFLRELAEGERVPEEGEASRKAFLRRMAQRYADRKADQDGGGPGDRVRVYKQTLGLLETLAQIPPRHRLFLDSEATFSERDMMKLHAQSRAILETLDVADEYDRRTRSTR